MATRTVGTGRLVTPGVATKTGDAAGSWGQGRTTGFTTMSGRRLISDKCSGSSNRYSFGWAVFRTTRLSLGNVARKSTSSALARSTASWTRASVTALATVTSQRTVVAARTPHAVVRLTGGA